MKPQSNANLDTRDLVIQTKTALDAHTETDEQHFIEIKDSFVEIKNNFESINKKMDKLSRNQIFAAGALAAIVCLMNYPQLIKTIEPDPVMATVPFPLMHKDRQK